MMTFYLGFLLVLLLVEGYLLLKKKQWKQFGIYSFLWVVGFALMYLYLLDPSNNFILHYVNKFFKITY